MVWKFDPEKAQWFKTAAASKRGITSEPAFDGHDLFSISELYHENTKTNTVEDLPPSIFSKAFKRYPGVEHTPLPHQPPESRMSLETAIKTRRSPIGFTGEPIALMDVAKLLLLTAGITGERPYDEKNSIYFRATPSAGGLYPLEVYPALFRVEGCEAGLYHYNVQEHALERLKYGDFSRWLGSACMENERILPASVAFIISAIFQRTKQKYDERAYRHVLMEAGHMGQNFYLAATAMHLACTTIGGFMDDTINQFLGIDGVDEAVIYLAIVGTPG